MMKRTLLLFDVDGTMLKTGGAGMRAMARVGSELFGEAFHWEGIEAGGSLDPVIFAEAAANNRLADPHLHHDRFRDSYLARLAEELELNRHQVRVLPGIVECLATLRQREHERRDVVLGLLTGNYTLAIPVKFAAIGVDPTWFSITAFGDEAPSRPDLVGLAMRRYREKFNEPANPRRVIVIGDTPRDVACAKAHGCIAFAIATGSHGVEELRACGADHAVADLSDPAPLYRLLY